ncbi:MAG: hypothetical protein H0U04_05225 [Rubrobacter sp.]|nr:hypothetical protein [Rubrobacter sp.]
MELIENHDERTSGSSLALDEVERLSPVAEYKWRLTGKQTTALPGIGLELEGQRLLFGLEADHALSWQRDTEKKGLPDPPAPPQNDKSRGLRR